MAGAVGVGVFFIQGCAHKIVAPMPVTAPESQALAPAPLANPLVLKLSAEKGRNEETVNCSMAVTESYVKDEIREKKIDSLDFRVRTTTSEVSSDGKIRQLMVTTEKEGDGLLHDYAYPELGEIIEMEYLPDGTVLRAGRFPKDSVFYLPAVPLPKKSIQPGDTWSNTDSWKSDVNGMKLKVNMQSKFLGPKICGQAMCAEVEVSGNVQMPEPYQKKTGFTHTIKGRYLFEPKRGLLVWSEFVSDELLQGKEVRAVLHSTLRSELVQPPGYRTPDHGEPSCPFETKEE